MRYIVCGAGAVGGVVGARLFERGAEVLLIARGDHLSTIRSDGLTIQSPPGSATLRIPAVGHPAEIAFRSSEDLVILATKTQDSTRTLDELREAAGSGIPVLCLQNGVESSRIALRRFERVGGAMVMLPSAYLQPGIVQAFSAPVTGIIDVGRFPSGEWEFLETVSADLCTAGFHSKVRSDILRWQHGKLLQNLKNALQALCGPEADYDDVVRGLRDEAEACYRAAGVAFASRSELAERASGLKLGQIAGASRPGDSSWQSLARATGSIETDFLNGEIAMMGRLHGVATPLNARLQELANESARERRPPGSLSAQTLRRLLRSAT